MKHGATLTNSRFKIPFNTTSCSESRYTDMYFRRLSFTIRNSFNDGS